jgi:hypothetical protein
MNHACVCVKTGMNGAVAVGIEQVRPAVSYSTAGGISVALDCAKRGEP